MYLHVIFMFRVAWVGQAVFPIVIPLSRFTDLRHAAVQASGRRLLLQEMTVKPLQELLELNAATSLHLTRTFDTYWPAYRNGYSHSVSAMILGSAGSKLPYGFLNRFCSEEMN